MQLEGKLLPFGGPRPVAPHLPSPRRRARWLQRWFLHYQPGAILGVFAVLVGVPLVLDLFVPPVRDWIDEQASHHEVGVNLLEHVLVAALVAAAAYYWVLGRKRQMALNSYRSLARDEPWRLVEWSQGKPPLVRRAMSKLLADGIERSPVPAVAVVQGRTGTGRTSFIVGLVQDLADKKLIPIPVLARRDGSFALQALARETFCRHIDWVLSSDQQADEIWHRARSTREIVVLVDGLDDELVEMLSRDDGSRLQTTVKELLKQRIAVVLATTRELPLGKEITPLREDLDLFGREEAERYVHLSLDGNTPTDDAIKALERHHDPVDGFLIAPFYLDVIVRLQRASMSLGNLPEHRDHWRAEVLAAYLEGIRRGRIVPRGSFADPDAPDRRGRAAVGAAEAVARKLGSERADLTVALKRVKVGGRALGDAVDLNLLWHGAERVGFASDDLGAYLVATTLDDPSGLLRDVRRIAESDRPRWRRDRHVLTALVFWHLRHQDQGPATFNRLLTDLEQGHWTRPAVIAVAVRIVSACGLTETSARVAAAADRCIDWLDTEEEREAEPRHAAELLRLVRALAEWPDPAAHRLLWRLATNRNIEVEWPAAKALAMAKGRPGETLRTDIEERLRRAEIGSTPAAMSRPDDVLGNEIASLAWILPALRGAGNSAKHLSRVAKLCLAEDMSPLRGEMSLAQGLKFAVVNGRVAAENVAHIRELLFKQDGSLHFWHARLVLVQAMLAHAWQHPKEADGLETEFAALRSRESHPLVRRGIDLASEGLRNVGRSSNGNYPLSRYMWIHERDAVRWVEQGKENVAQLAADAVLLSNMTYRLRKVNAPKADSVAVDSELPRCIRKSSDRQNITDGCECRQGLCAHPEDPAVVATRARFSESFCREQVRLVARRGPPPWTGRGIAAYRSKQRLQEFWDRQAEIAQRWSARAGPDGE
jgi:hypothetical protein